MGVCNLPALMLLCLGCMAAFGGTSGSEEAKSNEAFPAPLARLALLDSDADTEPTTEGMTGTSGPTVPPYTVNSLTEAITLAVISGICGPSLFALIGCAVRQYRLTKDDPFAGGERPVDEAAERRKRKRLQQQQQQMEEENEYESVNNNIRQTKAAINNDPLMLDRVTSLDLDSIRAKPLPSTKFSNTEKNFSGRVNVGFSKTAEDIL